MAQVINVDIQTINLLTGTFIPILVGVVSKKLSSSTLKSLMNSALSAVSGALAVVLAANGALEVKTFVISILTTFITSTAVYYGVWKPTGVAGAVQDKTAGFGVGSQQELEPTDAGHL